MHLKSTFFSLSPCLSLNFLFTLDPSPRARISLSPLFCCSVPNTPSNFVQLRNQTLARRASLDPSAEPAHASDLQRGQLIILMQFKSIASHAVCAQTRLQQGFVTAAGERAPRAPSAAAQRQALAVSGSACGVRGIVLHLFATVAIASVAFPLLVR